MSDWVAALVDQLATGTPVVRLAVATVRGSAPREPGATLLFWVDAQGRRRSRGSIGGGHLEARALDIAEQLLVAGAPRRRVERFALGASFAQCCGGVVELYWERFDDLAEAQALARAANSPGGLLRYCAIDGSGIRWPSAGGHGHDGAGRRTALPPPLLAGRRAGLFGDGPACYFVEHLFDEATPLWLYGAGHVGRALVQVLAGLPFRISWVDSRAAMLAEALDQSSARAGEAALAGFQPAAPVALLVDDPQEAAAMAPAGAWHLVMTHSHEHDLRVCEWLLKRDEFAFLGLIGSRSKDARFRHRLLQRGCAPGAVARLVCPVGVAGITAKLPAAIAVSIAAQLLRERELGLHQAPRAEPIDQSERSIHA